MLFSNLFVKNVVQDLTSAGIDWQREKWQSGLGSKFIHQGEKNAAKYADEVIVHLTIMLKPTSYTIREEARQRKPT